MLNVSVVYLPSVSLITGYANGLLQVDEYIYIYTYGTTLLMYILCIIYYLHLAGILISKYIKF